MKKLLLILVCCSSVIATSQEMKRENVNGKIIVEGGNIEGITIYNKALNLGVETNQNGEFTIPVDIQDMLEIRFLEYQNMNLTVNEAMLASKKMNIFFIEEADKLDDVIITNKKLTGNMKADLSNLAPYTPTMDAMYFGIKNSDAYALSAAAESDVEIVGMPAQEQLLVHGLNVVNVVDQLLIPLFRAEVKDKKAAGVPEVPATSIKYYLGANFLVENFNIPPHRVEEFIRYVEDDEFDFDLLNYGHELELLQVINSKSTSFLSTNSDSY